MEKQFTIQENFPKALQRSVIIKKVRLEIENALDLSEEARTPQNEGIIYAFGKECKAKFSVGGRFIYNSLANQYIIFEGEMYHIVHENDIRAEVIQEDGVTTLKAYAKAVMVERLTEDDMLSSGLILPQMQSFNKVGTVVAVGEDVADVKKGDKIIFSMYVDSEFPFRGRNMTSMAETDVFAILPEGAMSNNEDLGRERRPDMRVEDMPEIDRPQTDSGTITHDLQ